MSYYENFFVVTIKGNKKFTVTRKLNNSNNSNEEWCYDVYEGKKNMNIIDSNSTPYTCISIYCEKNRGTGTSFDFYGDDIKEKYTEIARELFKAIYRDKDANIRFCKKLNYMPIYIRLNGNTIGNPVRINFDENGRIIESSKNMKSGSER